MRKQLLTELTSSQNDLEHVVTWNELPDGKPLTFPALKLFLEQQKAVAVSSSEKIAGCQARMRSRGN